MAFTLMPDQPRDIRAIYVSDMARAPVGRSRSDQLDRCQEGLFVISSRRQGGMGAAEAVPFGNRAAADAYSARKSCSI